MTEAEMRVGLERDMLIRQVRQVDVVEKISVTEEEARAFYAANTKEFTTPGEVTLREILIAVPVGDVAGADATARATAEEVRKRLAAPWPQTPRSLKTLVRKALDLGVSFATRGNLILLAPPLVIGEDDLGDALALLDRLLGEMESA
jgi:hypothetical protein